MSGVTRFWIYTAMLVAGLLVAAAIGGHQYDVELAAAGPDVGDDDLGGLYAIGAMLVAALGWCVVVVVAEVGHWARRRHRG